MNYKPPGSILMNIKMLNSPEINIFATQQLFSLENGLSKGDFNLREIGNLIPGSVMVHELDTLKPQRISYMNDWGCENLGHALEEINAMGSTYYERFFEPEQSKTLIAGITDYYQRQDHSSLYSFFQQVRSGVGLEYNWYYTVCKFMRESPFDLQPTRMIIIANPVAGMGLMVNKVNRILEQSSFVAKNYRKFASLTKREKEIITLLTEGRSSPEISDLLFISKHTVSKHRRNIVLKLEIHSFAELLKFAIAFELIR